MKRIIAISGIILMTLGIFSCKNQSWSFPDFDYTTTYFPIQYPVRTLVLGDYMYDNSMDKELKFLISAATGGVYENKENIKVGFTVDNSLTENLFTSTNLPIKAMPSDWYTLSSTNELTIPKGLFSGGVTVQLTEDFLNDTNSVGVCWAIPLKITSATTDSVLRGKTGMDNPDPRIAANWATVPKDFTIFGVKFVNEWHGKYLLRGTDVVKRAVVDTVVQTITYRDIYLEKNAVVSLLTSRRNQVKYSNSVRGSGGNFEMKLDFNTNDITQATLSSTTRYPQYPVAGTAKMVLAKDSPESWGNKSRDVIYLDYTITEGDKIHYVKDTLVFRDKAVKYEEYAPKVVLP